MSKRLSGFSPSMNTSVNFFLMGCRGSVPSRRGLAKGSLPTNVQLMFEPKWGYKSFNAVVQKNTIATATLIPF